MYGFTFITMSNKDLNIFLWRFEFSLMQFTMPFAKNVIWKLTRLSAENLYQKESETFEQIYINIWSSKEYLPSQTRAMTLNRPAYVILCPDNEDHGWNCQPCDIPFLVLTLKFQTRHIDSLFIKLTLDLCTSRSLWLYFVHLHRISV